MSKPVVINEYDRRWLVLNDRELRVSVLSSILKQMERIGSTAVPGLTAKPIINILPLSINTDLLLQCSEHLDSV